MRGWSMDDVLEHVCGYAKTVLDLPILSVADEGNHCSCRAERHLGTLYICRNSSTLLQAPSSALLLPP